MHRYFFNTHIYIFDYYKVRGKWGSKACFNKKQGFLFILFDKIKTFSDSIKICIKYVAYVLFCCLFYGMVIVWLVDKLGITLITWGATDLFYSREMFYFKLYYAGFSWKKKKKKQRTESYKMTILRMFLQCLPTTKFLSSCLFNRGTAERHIHTVAEQDEV